METPPLKAVKKILENAYNTAEGILATNREALDKVADLLIEHEKVEGRNVMEMLNVKDEGEEE